MATGGPDRLGTNLAAIATAWMSKRRASRETGSDRFLVPNRPPTKKPRIVRQEPDGQPQQPEAVTGNPTPARRAFAPEGQILGGPLIEGTTSIISEEASEYQRPVTHEWDKLLRFAHSEMADSGEEVPTNDVNTSVWKAVDALDNETLEDARFQGIGLVMCGMARSLQEPATRTDLVNRSASLLAHGWGGQFGSGSSRGLLTSDIMSSFMNMPYESLAQQSAESLPRHTVLVADILNLVSIRRSNEIAEMGGSKIRKPKGRASREPTDGDLDRLRKGNQTSLLVANATTSAASRVIRVILDKRYQWLPEDVDPVTGQVMQFGKYDTPSVAEALDGSDLSELNSTQVALRGAASMRIDEFLLNLEHCVEITAEGIAIFPKEKVVKSRDLPPSRIIDTPLGKTASIHNARLKCPAVHIEGFIPMVVDIVNDTVGQAQKLVNQRLERKRASRFGMY